MSEVGSFHKSWNLHGHLDEFLVSFALDCPPGTEKNRASWFAFEGELDHWFDDFWATSKLTEIYEQTGGVFHKGPSADQIFFHRQELKAHLKKAVQTGQLVILVKPRRIIQVKPPVVKPVVVAPPEELTSWIEIYATDENGKAMPGKKYLVTTPDGSRREGTLNAEGTARISGIRPGTCRVSFPEFDAATWHAA
jgi:hypothetical protein